MTAPSYVPPAIRRRSPELVGRLEAAARAVVAGDASPEGSTAGLVAALPELEAIIAELDERDRDADAKAAAAAGWRALQDAWMAAHPVTNVGPMGPCQGGHAGAHMEARWSFDDGRTVRCKRHADQAQLRARENALAAAWDVIEPGSRRESWTKPTDTATVYAIAGELGLAAALR